MSLCTGYSLWVLGPFLGSKSIEQKTCLGGALEEAMSESGEAQGGGHISESSLFGLMTKRRETQMVHKDMEEGSEIVRVRVGLGDQAWSLTVSQKAMALNVPQEPLQLPSG